jgi:hypothetical protein
MRIPVFEYSRSSARAVALKSPLHREIAAFARPRAFMPQGMPGRGVLREINLCGLERVSHKIAQPLRRKENDIRAVAGE